MSAAPESAAPPAAEPPETPGAGDRPDGSSAPALASATSGTQPGAALIFDDPLDRPSSDDTDRGWGDVAAPADDDFMRFLNEKPPHHL